MKKTMPYETYHDNYVDDARREQFIQARIEEYGNKVVSTSVYFRSYGIGVCEICGTKYPKKNIRQLTCISACGAILQKRRKRDRNI